MICIPCQPESGSYLAIYGSITPEKHIERAIEIALRSGMPLKIAAKTGHVDHDYVQAELLPLLSNPSIDYVGEIADAELNHFLGHAAGLLMPIDWPDPSGLTAIEALACGTPTIAYRSGALPEIVEDGRTGFIVDNVEEAVQAVAQLKRLNRPHCREVFQSRFSADRMVQDYLHIYDRLLTSEMDRIAT